MSRLIRRAAYLLFVFILLGPTSSGAGADQTLHHDVVVQVSPDTGSLELTDHIVVSGRASISFDIASWLNLDQISIDGRAVKANVSGSRLSVDLPSRERHLVKVVASGLIPDLDLDNASSTAGSSAFAGSEGAYLPSWTGWLPTVPTVQASYRLSVQTSSMHRSTATGMLKGEKLGAGKNTSVFETSPSKQPPSLFVGPYVVAERQVGAIRLRTYFHRSAAGLASRYLDAAERFIGMYERQIGAYPFADFYMVSAPLPVGLGFRNLTYVDRRILRLPFMQGRSLAHEVLHNWWGNGVTADYGTGNWAEGLTTYMADHALAELEDQQRAKEMRQGWLRDYAALPRDRDIQVNRFVSKQHDAAQVVGYGKVAFIFHMLKHEVGPGKFVAAIQRFWKERKFAIAGWNDIENAFETEAQRDLDWFFRQWVDRAGAPKLWLEDVKATIQDGVHTVSFTVAQKTPAYRLSVPVQVRTEDGLERTDVMIHGERADVRVPLASKPNSVQIDPDHILFRRLLPEEARPIMRDILLDRKARVQILHSDEAAQQAARVLAGRLLNREPESFDTHTDAAEPYDGSAKVAVIIFGSAQQIDSFTDSSGALPRSKSIAGKGSSRVWTSRMLEGKAILFVEADDAQSIRAMLRALPHYRSKSFVIFEGRRVIDNGVWPLSEVLLSHSLD